MSIGLSAHANYEKTKKLLEQTISKINKKNQQTVTKSKKIKQ